MPLYPFSCEAHGDFDVLRPMAEVQPTEKCPLCKNQCKRQWTPPSVTVFKGQYIEALDAYVGSRAQEREVIDKINDKSGGKIAVEWH
jgi:putative FmdB family regulatory protein